MEEKKGPGLHTEVDRKHFKEKVTIEKTIKAEGEGVKYCYQVGHKGVSYIVRGYRIRFLHATSEKEANIDELKEGPIEVNEIYQEYAFLKSTSIFNLHLAKPLDLEMANVPGKDKDSPSYMYIEILFDHRGQFLNEMGPLSMEMSYNLMRQSSYALFMLHNTGGNCFSMKPEYMVYDKESDMLKIIDMGGIFGSPSRKKAEGVPVIFESELRLCFPEYAPPEILRMVEKMEPVAEILVTANAIDVYCWAMVFSTMILKRVPTDLLGENKKFKLGSEENYKDYLAFMRTSLDTVETKNDTEKQMWNILEELILRALSYKPNERPTTREIVSRMKELEKEKNINIKFAETEATNAKHLMKLLMLDTSD
jgi:hypothetical protein